MPPQPQQQRTPGRSRAGWIILCPVLVVVLLVAGIAVFFAWLNLHPHGPRFTVDSLSISRRQVAFNVSDTNPNRHFGYYYKGANTRASLLYYDQTVASGPAFAGDWYQPSMNTTSITGVIDVVVDDPSFSACLLAGHPLILQLTTDVSFGFLVFHSVQQTMQVSCDLLVGKNGRLLRESVGEPCNTYFLLMDDDY